MDNFHLEHWVAGLDKEINYMHLRQGNVSKFVSQVFCIGLAGKAVWYRLCLNLVILLEDLQLLGYWHLYPSED